MKEEVGVGGFPRWREPGEVGKNSKHCMDSRVQGMGKKKSVYYWKSFIHWFNEQHLE